MCQILTMRETPQLKNTNTKNDRQKKSCTRITKPKVLKNTAVGIDINIITEFNQLPMLYAF